MTEAAKTLTIDHIISAVNNLPSPPAVVLDLINSLGDDNCDTDQLAKKVETDQGLVSKTLRLANSPFYGLHGRINNVREAITVLGFRTVRSMLLATGIAGPLNKVQSSGFNLEQFWQHALETAFAARALAPVGCVSPEHAFVAGLLHDVGKLVLATVSPHHTQLLMEHCQTHQCNWYQAERALNSPSHMAVGAALARKWHFPETLCISIESHHEPISCDHPMTRVIHAADIIVRSVATSPSSNSHCIPAFDDTAWQRLAPKNEHLIQAVRAVRSSAGAAQLFLA